MSTDTKIVATSSGEFANLVIHVDGLSQICRYLSKHEPEVRDAIADALKESANPILAKARSLADRIRHDGTFANSMSIVSRKSNLSVALRSNDKAAGVKEFAKQGAKTATSKGTKLADSRLAKRSGVGVPAGKPPRAMIPAVNTSIEEVRSSIAEKIDQALTRGLNG